MSIDDLDNFEFDEISTREISEDEVPDDIRKKPAKDFGFTINSKAKATIRKVADLNNRIIDNANIADFVFSLISSIICLVYTSTVEKKWKFDKHSKLINFLFTGSTKPEQLKILAPIMKAYNIACIIMVAPFTVAAIIKKLRK
jgi:hypothetical protein